MSDDGDGTPGPGSSRISAAAIADRLRLALESADLDRLGALLSPDVHWGPPRSTRPPCRNREQVLAWYSKGRTRGRRARVREIEIHGDALLVGLRLDDGRERWQVLRVGPDGIDDIRGYEDRRSATGELGS